MRNPSNILIVGGSRGIGLGFVRHYLVQESTKTLFVTYRPARAGALLTLKDDFPEKLHLVEMDVTDETSIEAASLKVAETVDHINMLLYTVGWLHTAELSPEKTVKHLNTKQLLDYFQINAIGAALCARFFRELLKAADSSVLAAISAKVGSIGDNRIGGWYGYRASKCALNMLLKTVAIEYSRSHPNCSVIALHPGTTDTELSKPFQKYVPPKKLFSVDRSVSYLTNILEQCEPKDTGKFFSWDGTEIPW